jgi:uncharacterized protein (TIGR00290 family)
MSTRPKALIAWSSGKDSAWALHEVRRVGEIDVVGALTTVTDTFGRVSIHGLREELLMAQLDAAGLAATIVRIPYPCPNEIYEREMAAAMEVAKEQGITHMIFGDLFLEDVRAYRETRLAPTGITPVFPLWHKPTDALAREMIEAGVDARLVCVDLKVLPKQFAGRRFDDALLADFPAGIDPCGENGEFHSFVAAGPMLQRAIPITVGETVERDGFAYTDVTPALT